MALSFIYREPGPVDTDITGRVVLRPGENPVNMASNAEERSVGAWTLDVEDPLGEFQFNSQRTFYVLEDDADDPVIFVGQTEDKGSTRGDQQRTGTERTIGLNLIDLNTLLERRVIREGDGGNRPAETDYERMIWLQGTGYIGGGTDWIFDDFSAAMDANDFTGRMASEVIEDCMGQSGANCYMFRDADTELFTTYYGDPSSDLDRRTSDLRISNIETDIDADAGFGDPGPGKDWVWGASRDTNWDELSTRVYGAIFGNYDGGAIFEERSATVAAFSHRDTVLSWPDVKSEAKATARALRMLDDIGTEEHRITTSIEVTAEHVNDALQGERIQCRFSHFPPYVDWTWMRILNRAVTWLAFGRYRIQFELSATPPPPSLSCSTVIGTIDGWEEGEHHNVFDTGPVEFDPLPTISAYPSIVIGFFAGMNQTEPVWRGAQSASVTGFTEWGDSRDGWLTDAASIALAGYKSIGGGVAGTMAAAWTGAGSSSGVQSWNALGIAFPTSAAAPVHTGWQNGSGDTATLDGTPTVGNLLVICRFTEQGAGFVTGPDGATMVVDGTMVANINNGYMDIWVRCVEEGDTEDIAVGDTSFSHWSFVSEWALT